MSVKKSLLPVLLAVVMVFAMMPLAAGTANAEEQTFVQEGVEYRINGAYLGVAGYTDDLQKNVTIPERVSFGGKDYLVVEIRENAFSNCSVLEKITISKNVQHMGDAFAGCTNLKEIKYLGTRSAWTRMTKNIEIPSGVVINCWDDNKYTDNGIVYILQEDNTAVGYAHDGDMQGEVIIPKSILAYGMNYKVTELHPGVFNETDVTKVSFGNGSELEIISTAAFYGCRKLKEVVIPDTVTFIDVAAFNSCTSLEKISIPSGVQDIGTATFSGCSSLKEVELKNGLKTIGSAAFSGCTSLKEIVIPGSVTGISEAAFSGAGLEKVTFLEPSSLKQLGSGAFYKCSGLKEVVLPDGLTTIGNGVFDTCSNLQKVTIPASVTSIGKDAFDGCTALTEITYYGTQEQWKNIGGDAAGLPDGFVPDCAQDINGAAVVLVQTAFTYNGKVQKPAVKTVGGSALKEGTDFSVSFSASPKNAGTYTMTITGMKKYAGTTKATFRISKAANTMTAKGKKPKVKYKKLKKKAQKIKTKKAFKVSAAQGTVTYKLVSAKKGSKKIKLKKAKKQFKITAKTGKIKVKKKLKKGTYKLKVKVTAAGNANYNALAKTVTVKIKVK